MMRVGVLMGGASLEKEVSFNSGRTICDYIDRSLYMPVPLFINEEQEVFILPWQFLYRGKISDFLYRLSEAKKITWQEINQYIDFAYIALHGTYGEDGCIQGLLEIFKIPYSGSSLLTSAICINKEFIGNLLLLHDIKVPQQIKIKKNEIMNFAVLNDFLYRYKKVIIKPIQEGSSIGISVVDLADDIESAINIAKYVNVFPQDVLIQEYIYGDEFSIIAIQEDQQWIIFEPTEIIFHKNFCTYEEKYLPGAMTKHTPARFSQELMLAIKKEIMKIISIIEAYDIIRVDGIIDKNKNIYITDINIFPGTAPSSFTFLQAAIAGFSPVNLINTIIKNALQRYKKNYAFPQEKNIVMNNAVKKIRIAVLLGGSSNEKEISLESGRNIFYKLPLQYYDPKVIFVSQKNKFYLLSLEQIVKDTTNEIANSIKPEQEILFSDFSCLFDFVFIGLHGGQGEDGTIQKQLEAINMPFNGPGSQSSHICMNKNETLNLLEACGLGTTKRIIVNKNSSKRYIKEIIKDTFKEEKKFIVKPNDDGCSALVNIAYTIEEIIFYAENIFSCEKTECLIEQYVEGIEITVGMLGSRDGIMVLPITQTVKSKNVLSIEEKFLPGAGENITPAFFTEEDTVYIQNQIKKGFEMLGCEGYSRMDAFFIPEEKKVIILECNTLPAMTPATCFFHQAAEIGLNPTEVINYIIYLGFLRQKCKNHELIAFLENMNENANLKIKKNAVSSNYCCNEREINSERV